MTRNRQSAGTQLGKTSHAYDTTTPAQSHSLVPDTLPQADQNVGHKQLAPFTSETLCKNSFIKSTTKIKSALEKKLQKIVVKTYRHDCCAFHFEGSHNKWYYSFFKPNILY